MASMIKMDMKKKPARGMAPAKPKKAKPAPMPGRTKGVAIPKPGKLTAPSKVKQALPKPRKVK